MLKILRELLTGKDGISHDLGRYSWMGSFFAVISAAAANWWHGVALDVQQLATALGIVAGAHGAALWAKKDTEPKPPEEPKS
jgi:hypothetical protein